MPLLLFSLYCLVFLIESFRIEALVPKHGVDQNDLSEKSHWNEPKFVFYFIYFPPFYLLSEVELFSERWEGEKLSLSFSALQHLLSETHLLEEN